MKNLFLSLLCLVWSSAFAAVPPPTYVGGFLGTTQPVVHFTSAVRATNVTMIGGTYYGTNLNSDLICFQLRSNAILSQLIITNNVPIPTGGNPVTLVNIGTAGGPNDNNSPSIVRMDNVYLKSTTTGGGPDTTLALFSGADCFLDNVHVIGESSAVDTRGVRVVGNNCIFETTTDGSIAYLANDDATNYWSNSRFIGFGAGGGSSCNIQWVRSKCTYNYCFFGMDGLSGDVVLHLSEDPSVGIYNSCIFDLAYNNASHICDLIGFDSDGYMIELNNCFIIPPTNGVVVDNTVGANHTITVRGGNILPSNFKDPSKVNWGAISGNGIVFGTNTVTWATNAIPPANTTTIRSWLLITNQFGKACKLGVYE